MSIKLIAYRGLCSVALAGVVGFGGYKIGANVNQPSSSGVSVAQPMDTTTKAHRDTLRPTKQKHLQVTEDSESPDLGILETRKTPLSTPTKVAKVSDNNKAYSHVSKDSSKQAIALDNNDSKVVTQDKVSNYTPVSYKAHTASNNDSRVITPQATSKSSQVASKATQEQPKTIDSEVDTSEQDKHIGHFELQHQTGMQAPASDGQTANNYVANPYNPHSNQIEETNNDLNDNPNVGHFETGEPIENNDTPAQPVDNEGSWSNEGNVFNPGSSFNWWD